MVSRPATLCVVYSTPPVEQTECLQVIGKQTKDTERKHFSMVVQYVRNRDAFVMKTANDQH